MSSTASFQSASPYQKDILALPVKDIAAAADWYGHHFGMKEVERTESPIPTVILERNGVRIGFAVNGGDATQDGAAIRVNDIEKMRSEMESTGIEIGNPRVDERDGKRFKVFFVVAPDGLCYYFHEPIDD